jgi:shikimate dehydrogenase
MGVRRDRFEPTSGACDEGPWAFAAIVSSRPAGRAVAVPRATTAVYGVIGDPVRHSLSPDIHNAAFQAFGLDAVYVAFPVADGQGAAALGGMRTFGLAGLSVTMPHKTAIARAVDEASDDVASLDAANTVVRLPNGRLRAESTDGPGCVDALLAAGCDPAGKRCLVIGAGGAGRSVVLALVRSGATEIAVVNRDDGRAANALALAGPLGVRRTIDAVSDAEIIINATPQGMGAWSDLPLDPERLAVGQVVNDLIYSPRETPLLAAARAAGATCVDGLGMLLHQGARQFALWTGEQAPLDAMRAAAEAELLRRSAAH